MYKIYFFFIFLVSAPLLNSAQSLTVSNNNKYIQVNPKGKPFLWIADTAWELFHVLDRAEADHYLETRAKQGFTVIYAVLIAELGGLNIPNAYGHLPLRNRNPANPDVKYFEHVDYVIRKAEKLGLKMGILPAWGSYVPNEQEGFKNSIFNKDNALQYGRFLGNRYKNSDIIWVMGGDRNIDDPAAKEIWNQIASGINEGSNKASLMTYHPRGASYSSIWFHHSPWLSFNMYQTSHERKAMPTYEYAEKHRKLQPRKPFIDGEPAYEDIPVKFWEQLVGMSAPRIREVVLDEQGLIKDKSFFKKGFFTDKDIRKQNYWSILSGAFGISYGNNAVWQFADSSRKRAVLTLQYWKEALHSPGAEQLRHLKYVMKTWDFTSLEPNQSLISQANADPEYYITAASKPDQSLILIYIPENQEFAVNLTEGRAYKAKWFNPQNGKLKKHPASRLTETVKFNSPEGVDDWLLILEATN